MAQRTLARYLTEAQRAEMAAQWNQHPGMQHLGATLDLSLPGLVRATIDPLQPFHRGGLGTDAVNGAVIAGMFDLVIGLAGYLHTRGRRAGVAQLSIQFLRPVEGDRLHVGVEDDGIGFDREAVVSADVRRFGLEAMRERAESIGGVLQVDSAPGRGTRVSLALPLAGRG